MIGYNGFPLIPFGKNKKTKNEIENNDADRQSRDSADSANSETHRRMSSSLRSFRRWFYWFGGQGWLLWWRLGMRKRLSCHASHYRTPTPHRESSPTSKAVFSPLSLFLLFSLSPFLLCQTRHKWLKSLTLPLSTVRLPLEGKTREFYCAHVTWCSPSSGSQVLFSIWFVTLIPFHSTGLYHTSKTTLMYGKKNIIISRTLGEH